MSIKAKHFWEIMCEVMGFRFFAGTPIPEFKKLFNSMNSNKMHYIPTTTEETALGLVSGVYLSGIKGGVIMSSIYFDKLALFINEFSNKYKIPFLLIVENDYNPIGLKQFDIYSLKQLDIYLYSDAHKPCIMVVKEGDLS